MSAITYWTKDRDDELKHLLRIEKLTWEEVRPYFPGAKSRNAIQQHAIKIGINRPRSNKSRLTRKRPGFVNS